MSHLLIENYKFISNFRGISGWGRAFLRGTPTEKMGLGWHTFGTSKSKATHKWSSAPGFIFIVIKFEINFNF